MRLNKKIISVLLASTIIFRGGTLVAQGIKKDNNSTNFYSSSNMNHHNLFETLKISGKSDLIGCDISEFQTNINWDLAKENFDFMILRLCYGTQKDERFDENSLMCENKSIAYGVYCFNTVRPSDFENKKEFLEQFELQTRYVIQALKEKN